MRYRQVQNSFSIKILWNILQLDPIFAAVKEADNE